MGNGQHVLTYTVNQLERYWYARNCFRWKEMMDSILYSAPIIQAMVGGNWEDRGTGKFIFAGAFLAPLSDKHAWHSSSSFLHLLSLSLSSFATLYLSASSSLALDLFISRVFLRVNSFRTAISTCQS
ncbi:hypothetical protein AAC387_Pa03g0104 [Persea americana]